MWRSFKNKIGLLLVIVAIVPLLIIFFIFSKELKQTLLRQKQRNIEKVQKYLKNTFEFKKKLIINYLNLLKEITGIRDAVTYTINTKDRKPLIEAILPYYKQIGLDTLQIIKKDGEVLVRTDDVESIGESLKFQNVVKQALEGKLSIGLEKERGIYLLKGTVPLKTAEGIVGVICIGEFLDKEFAEEISQVTLTELAIFYKKKLIASSFSKKKIAEKKLYEIINRKVTGFFPINGKLYHFSPFTYSLGEAKSPLLIAIGINAEPLINTERRMKFILVVLLGIIGTGSVFVGFFFYHYYEICYGPRLIYSTLVFIVIISALGIERISHNFYWKKTKAIIIGLLCFFYFRINLPLYLEYYKHSYWGVNREVHEATKKNNIHNAVVFFNYHGARCMPHYKTREGNLWGAAFMWNSPLLDSDVIFARDLGEHNKIS